MSTLRRRMSSVATWRRSSLACAAFFLGVDAWHLATASGGMEVPAVAKRAYVVLLALAVWTSGTEVWSPEDRRRLGVAFAFVVRPSRPPVGEAGRS